MNTNPATPTPTRNYGDLHDYVRALDEAGLLRKVDIPINKDTELCALVRWQFRGSVPEADRKAWLFTNVIDAKGRKYDMPVLIGAIASNTEMYTMGLGVTAEGAHETWSRALSHPIPPRVVEQAPCQEIVIEGADLDKPGQALDSLPAPIATPGWDNAPYLSAIGFISRDPDTGLQNLGTYRAQIKTPKTMGMNPSAQNRPGIYVHWLKYKERGEKMPVAYVIGGPMSVAYTGMWKVPESLDELAVAGGLIGQPLNVRLRFLGAANQFDHLRQDRIGSSSHNPRPQRSLAVDRASQQRIAAGFGYRQRLAGKPGFVHVALPGNHFRVQRNFIAGSDK